MRGHTTKTVSTCMTAIVLCLHRQREGLQGRQKGKLCSCDFQNLQSNLCLFKQFTICIIQTLILELVLARSLWNSSTGHTIQTHICVVELKNKSLVGKKRPQHNL